MDLDYLSDDFAICGQISVSDVAELAADGFKTIICARPDDEQADQPPFARIREAASEHGLTAFYVPVQPSGATKKDHDAFKETLQGCDGRVLGYCRSGKRAGDLWRALQIKA